MSLTPTITSTITEHSARTGTLEINYAEGPANGPPLVLLHGGSARWQQFAWIIPDLIASWHVFAPDFRGHGKSGRGTYRVQNFAEDIAHFLGGTVARPAILFGHSLGGSVAIVVAALHPGLVSALIVGDAPFLSTSWRNVVEETRERLAAWRDLCGQSVDAILPRLREMLVVWGADPTPRRAAEAFGEDSPWFTFMAESLNQHDPAMLALLLEDFDSFSAGYDYERLLPRIECPVLILQADPNRDAVLTDSEVDLALSLLPRARVARLKGVGHALHTEQKEPVLSAMTQFLASLSLES